VSTALVDMPGEEIVFLGKGDGTFQAPITSAGIEYPANAVAGDFNGDGKLDLAVNGPATTYRLLGNGDGTFRTPTAAFPGNGPLAAADVNGDGKSDLISEVSATEEQTFLGSGNGTFSNASNYLLTIPVGSDVFPQVSPIGIADFNGDGKLDLALGGYVLLGNGDGTFQGIQLGAVPVAPTAAVVGNFNNNATLDVAAVTNQQGGPYNLYILKNNGSGALSVTNTYTLQQPGQSIVTGDVNGDGNLDLVVIGMDPSTQNWSYSVLLGNGDGSFQTPSFSQQSLANPGAAVLADFNNDHKLDLALSVGDQSVAILLGNGDGTFMSPVSYFDPGSGAVVADFNGDGNLDIASGTGTETWILYGNGNGTFQAAVGPESLNNFSAAYTADINNDGKPDLISSSQVALGNGDGTFTVLAALPSPEEIFAIGDLNGDGKPDLIVSANTANSSQGGVLLGNGDGTFGALISIPLVNVPPTTVFVADMNGDGRPDLIFPKLTSGVAVLLNATPSGIALSATALSPATVTGGNSATSTVTVTSTFGFSGMVNLSCAITPLMTPAPTCILSGSSVQITAGGMQSVTVTVATTGQGGSSTAPYSDFPLKPKLPTWAWTLVLLGSGCVLLWNRKRLADLAAPLMVLALALCVGCGGSNSPHTIPAPTSAGTYTATVTATSGSVTQTMALQVVVQ